jgi:hypothetical protein
VDFAKQLTKQLNFLGRSSAAFDRGHADESIRIATSLRVIFRDTPNSTSLLQHLDAVNIQVRSRVPDRKLNDSDLEGRAIIVEYSQSLLLVTFDGVKPDLGSHPSDRMIPATDWWNETVARNEHTYTRRLIVSWAADRDGGAHVDGRAFPAAYEAMIQPGSIGTFENAQTGGPVPIEDIHLIMLRTMASEVLTSPDLCALAA